MPKEKKDKVVIQLLGFDAAHYRRTEAYVKQIDKLCKTAADEFAALAGSIKNPQQDKPFSFADYPKTRKQAQQITKGLAGSITTVIQRGTAKEWNAACDKNDAFINSILRTSRLTPEEAKQYQARNLEALQSFQTRKIEGMGLSQRVWKYTQDIQDTIELGVDVGLGEGRSAQQLSRDLRQCLKEPNRLFRRVRDKYGNLQLSKAAKLYHSGQGVYRSSAKNAMRLARTEIKMAYRESEYRRWQQLDFVVGFRISLSNNHTIKGKDGKPHPFRDMCDELVGDYPKTFRFVGWHPQCRCVVTPILNDYDEYNKNRAGRLKAIVNGTAYNSLPSRRQVTAMPENFTNYIETIRERAKGWSSQPYYIKQNFEGGTIEGGLKAGVAVSLKGNPSTQQQIQNNTKVISDYDAQISKLKREAYSLGLDVSKIDELRLQGDRGKLLKELSKIEDLANKRLTEWNAAEQELKQVISEAIQEGYRTISQQYERTLQNFRISNGIYYADAIKNLQQATSKAKAELKAAQQQRAEAVKNSSDKPHPAIKTYYTSPIEVRDTIKKVQDGLKESWFKHGVGTLNIETDPRCNGSTIRSTGSIWLTAERLNRVERALEKIARRQSADISVDEADAMATYWHEITHNRNITDTGAGSSSSLTRRYMEMANEFVARKTLPEFYAALGVKNTPQPQFMNTRRSTGYNGMVVSYDRVIDKLQLNRDVVLKEVRKYLFTEDYSTQKNGLVRGLQAAGVKKRDGSPATQKEIEKLVRECVDYYGDEDRWAIRGIENYIYNNGFVSQ